MNMQHQQQVQQTIQTMHRLGLSLNQMGQIGDHQQLVQQAAQMRNQIQQRPPSPFDGNEQFFGALNRLVGPITREQKNMVREFATVLALFSLVALLGIGAASRHHHQHGQQVEDGMTSVTLRRMDTLRTRLAAVGSLEQYLKHFHESLRQRLERIFSSNKLSRDSVAFDADARFGTDAVLHNYLDVRFY
uniref:DUF2207 domain-containing protein n=1 Tax=Globodera pallida TaxID=36090 RepID=A0A183BX88_GLOPA